MTETLVIKLVVAAYLLVMLGVGIASGRFVKSSGDFLIGGRRIPWWVAGTSVYMSAFSVFTFVADAGNAYTHGMVGALINVGPVLGWFAAGLLTASLWNRSRIVTPVEYLEERFGPEVRKWFALLSILFSLNSIATRLFAFSVLAGTLLDMPVSHVIVISGIVVAVYSLMGGLWAVVLTDVIQFIILLIGIIPLVALSLIEIWGFTGFSEWVSSDAFSWSKTDRNYIWLMGWWGVEIINALFRFEGIQRFSAVPSESDARNSAFLASALLAPTLVAALIPIFAAAYLLPGISGEQAFASMVALVLPTGLVGLIMGAMFAATISALDSELNVSAGIIARDIYQRFINNHCSDNDLLYASRSATLILACCAVLCALLIASTEMGVFEWAEFVVSRFLVIPLLCFVLGLFFRRASTKGFIFSLVLGTTISMFLWGIGWSPSSVRFPVIVTCVLSMLVANTFFPASGREKVRVDNFTRKITTPCSKEPTTIAKAMHSDILKLIGSSLIAVSLIPLSIAVIYLNETSSSYLELWTGLSTLLTGLSLLKFSQKQSGEHADSSIVS
ncbi:MAG: sodium:solute symporter [Puniceicoccaceae bacterium]